MDHVVTWWGRCGAHATAPLVPATPGHVTHTYETVKSPACEAFLDQLRLDFFITYLRPSPLALIALYAPQYSH